MLCEICKEREATARYVKVVGTDNVLDLHICKHCADKLLKSDAPDIDNSKNKRKEKGVRFNLSDSKFCPSCGRTLRDFVENDYLGCGDCFDSFRAYLGAISKLFQSDEEAEQSLTELKESLKKAVTEERFEEAALIRDKIKRLLSKKN